MSKVIIKEKEYDIILLDYEFQKRDSKVAMKVILAPRNEAD